MTLHISEIGVRLAIASGPEPNAGQPGSPAQAGAGGLSAEDREAIVQDCVQRVLASLKAEDAR